MTVSRADLERLTPEDVARYLRGAGWRPSGDLAGRAMVWEFDQHRLEVVVPVSARFLDYPQRMYEVIRTLAEAEARSEPEIVRSLTDASTDRPSFHLFPDAPSGMIPAADAAEAFQGVREVLIAAAYAERRPEPLLVLPSSKPRVVREFPDRALVSTEPGSFVINTHVTLPSGDALFEETSFERQVTRRMSQMIRTAHKVSAEAHQSAELGPFVDNARAGISRTLCQGLSRFGGADHDRPFEVRFAWASAAPVDLPDTPVRFAAEQVVMLSHASEDLGRQPTSERAEMKGRVQRLERRDPRDLGWVVVRGTLTIQKVSRVRQVWVPLNPDDYDRALRAHGMGLDVRLAGTLTRTGQRTELEPTEYFRVL